MSNRSDEGFSGLYRNLVELDQQRIDIDCLEQSPGYSGHDPQDSTEGGRQQQGRRDEGGGGVPAGRGHAQQNAQRVRRVRGARGAQPHGPAAAHDHLLAPGDRPHAARYQKGHLVPGYFPITSCSLGFYFGWFFVITSLSRLTLSLSCRSLWNWI